MFTVAIVGKTNVGKTTLFNRLVGRRIAIAHNSPGVTRDRKVATVEKSSMVFRLTDTPGLELASAKTELGQKAFRQSLFALDEADLCLFVVDGRLGLTVEDEEFVELLRKKNKDVIMVINKCESAKSVFIDEDEVLMTGLGQGVRVSAEGGDGIRDLLKAIKGYYKATKEDELLIPTSEKDKAFALAFVGRPNAGKSTMVNLILGEERVVVDKTPGTTRDTITIPLKYGGFTIYLVDTAGIRKKMKIADEIENESVQESFRAIDMAHVVCMMIDIAHSFDSQDYAIIQKILSEGRPVILMLNKADLLSKDELAIAVKEIRDKILFSDVQAVSKSFFTISAIEEKEPLKILNEVISIYNKWNGKIKTSELNNWLQVVKEEKKPPIINRKPMKLKFASQTSSRPPSITISSNFAQAPDEYVRFLKNNLSLRFGLDGVPLRMVFKKEANPFVSGSKVTKKRYK